MSTDIQKQDAYWQQFDAAKAVLEPIVAAIRDGPDTTYAEQIDGWVSDTLHSKWHDGITTAGWANRVADRFGWSLEEEAGK